MNRRRACGAGLATCAAWWSALVLSGCASGGVGLEQTRRISVDWASRLYELEALAYHPKDESQPLFVRSAATPPDGLVVVPGKDRLVRGLDARDGRVIWTAATKGPTASRPVDLAPFGAPEDVLVASMDGRVYRLSQGNGRAVWTSEHPGTAGITASPVVSGGADGRIFVTSLDDRITALSLATGAKLWSEERAGEAALPISGQAGAAVAGDVVVTGFSDGTLVAFAQEDGATVWTADLRGPERNFVDVDTTPVVVEVRRPEGEGSEKLVVAGSFSRGLSGVGLDDGLVRWTRPGEGFLSPIARHGVVYAPQASGFLWALEAATGAVKWVSSFSARFAGTPVTIGKYLALPVGAGLTLIDRDSGRQLLQWTDGRGVHATPAVTHGTLYVVGDGGHLYSLGIY